MQCLPSPFFHNVKVLYCWLLIKENQYFVFSFYSITLNLHIQSYFYSYFDVKYLVNTERDRMCQRVLKYNRVIETTGPSSVTGTRALFRVRIRVGRGRPSEVKESPTEFTLDFTVLVWSSDPSRYNKRNRVRTNYYR